MAERSSLFSIHKQLKYRAKMSVFLYLKGEHMAERSSLFSIPKQLKYRAKMSVFLST